VNGIERSLTSGSKQAFVWTYWDKLRKLCTILYSTESV